MAVDFDRETGARKYDPFDPTQTGRYSRPPGSKKTTQHWTKTRKEQTHQVYIISVNMNPLSVPTVVSSRSTVQLARIPERREAGQTSQTRVETKHFHLGTLTFQ